MAAVVAKTARVVEEVHVRAEAIDRVKTVCDRVRKTEIDVDKTDETARRTAAARSGGS